MIAEARQALESGSPSDMEAAYDKLTQASHKVASVLYESASQAGEVPPQEGPAGGDSNAGPGGPEDVIDAEFVDVDAEESR